MEFVEHKSWHKPADEKSLCIILLEANPEIKKQALMVLRTSQVTLKSKAVQQHHVHSTYLFNAGMVAHVHSSTCLTYILARHMVWKQPHDFRTFARTLAAVDGELGDDEDGKRPALELNSPSLLCMGMLACIQMPHEPR